MRTSEAALRCQRLALADEDLAVDAEQVLAFHALFAREGADQQCPVATLERLVRIVRNEDILEGIEAAILQLHGDAFQGRQRLGDFQQL